MKTRTRFAPGGAALLLAAVACSEQTPTTPAASETAAFAKTKPTAPPGSLSVCKAGLGGIDAGDPFSFEIELGAVVRVAEVGAGSCLDLAVPLEREPSSRGYYQRKTDEVNRLLPDGIGIVVDASVLDAGQVQAILRSTGVEAGSSLLLNLAQQLIAADLNVLRGAWPTPEVTQAMADANAGIAITQGPPIGISSSLAPSELSALVTVLTAFNEGKLDLPPAPSLTPIGITEIPDALTELISITCSPPAACSGLDVGTGSVTAATSSGQTTTVTFTNRARPVLRICKVAGTGVDEGTIYGFSAGGIDVVDARSVDVAAGDCSDAELLEGTYMLLEAVPAGEAVQSITCEPAAACTDPSTAVGQVTVAIARGLTTVTWVNRSTRGTLRICKVAGTGISNGAVFRFTAGGINLPEAGQLDVAAGGCGETELGEGAYMTTEAVPQGVAVSAITCDPADRCDNPSVGVGSVNATVVGGSLTTVTFTNRVTRGTLRICKIAGPGITTGQSFGFSAGGINVTDAASYDVEAGSCEDELLDEGDYMVAEALSPDVAVSAIDCDPLAACRDASLQVGVVTATVTGGATTTISFTNRSTIAVLNVCKVAGVGVGNGVPFDFTAGGIDVVASASFAVSSGSCGEVELPEGTYMLAEIVPAGFTVEAIVCSPSSACTNTSLAVGVVHVALTGAERTTVTFTNSAPVALHGVRSRVGGPDAAAAHGQQAGQADERQERDQVDAGPAAEREHEAGAE